MLYLNVENDDWKRGIAAYAKMTRTAIFVKLESWMIGRDEE